LHATRSIAAMVKPSRIVIEPSSASRGA
jgi:hypothetical protein